jgi:chromosome segregation protein
VFLRSLTLRGFKSFAEKTTLEFASGVSVIVGPNGSGKSNIADAISWVLGEQGPRSLRGASMSDVVFAGSPTRQPLGLAEVTLVIDNSAGRIDVPASEIEISRSIFRNGESEYRLGGRPCRLMDIQELLSDAGLGRAQHAVVGQGQLEEVLAARPEERRQLIEEAAGIAKHRRRRERAERKLAGLEGDLHRLQDLSGELRRQLKPLEKQAELATRHEALTVEAALLARLSAAAVLRDLLGEGQRRQAEWSRAEAEEAAARAAMADLDAAIARLEQRGAEAEAEELLVGEQHASAQAERSRLESEVRAALRWEAAARERLNESAGSALRLVDLQDEVRRTDEAAVQVRTSLSDGETRLAAAEEEYRALERERRELEERHRGAEAERAARRAQAESLRTSLAQAEAERGRVARSSADIAARLAAERTRERDLGETVERLDADAAPLGVSLRAREERRSARTSELAGLEATERGLAGRREELEQQLEELSETPGAAFARRRADRPIGVLSELIEAPRPYETALRSALGAFADAVVYESDEELLAEAAAADGGTGLILLTAGGADAPHPVAGERRLLDLVRVDGRVEALAASLLAGSYVVSNLAEAVTKHRIHPEAQFVTQAGVVVGPSWVRTPPGRGIDTQRLRRSIGGVDRELASVRRGLREGRQELAEVERGIADERSRLEALDGRIAATVEEMSGAAASIAGMHREAQLLEERLEGLMRSEASLRARLAADGLGQDAEHEAGGASDRSLPSRPDPPVSLRVEVESLRREVARLEAATAAMRRELERLSEADPEALARAVGDAASEREALERRLNEANTALAGVAERYRMVTATARGARSEHEVANRSWRAASVELERLRTQNDDVNRARSDLSSRIADAERTLREGHGVEPEAAVDTLGEDDTVESLRRRSDLVSRRRALIGRVNLLAAGELEELRERSAFLQRELDDVKAARRDLHEVIHTVDAQMAELFGDAFRDVAAQFAELFAMLFPGGEGRLLLIDPTDPLASGIEVEARPGRKRVRRLSLLSGGERSLTALAFLVAIFRARPSPFHLLDEVEAALDDVNLHRFLDVLAALAGDSQVLLVTHQKRTMEMADVLYGVTMGADGTSRVISQRLGSDGELTAAHRRASRSLSPA